MRKTIMYIAASLDGYIARTNGDVDWLEPDDSFDFKPFDRSVDTVLMGYKTYEKSLTFKEEAIFKGKDFYVFTHDHLDTEDSRVKFINTEPGQFIKQIRENPGLDIWLMGGGILNASFLAAGIVDELQIFYMPILLGQGIPLFQGSYPQTTLKLLHQNAYPKGLVELKYQVLKV